MKVAKRLSAEKRQQIIDLARKGYTTASISRQIPCTVDAVKRWAPLKNEKNPKLQDLPRGRPKSKASPAVKHRIKEQLLKGSSLRKVAERVTTGGERAVSKSTAGRIAKSGREPLVWLPVSTKRRLSERNRDLRVAFCSGVVTKRPAFRKWIFTDAKDLYCYKYPHGMHAFAWGRPGSKKPSLVQGTGAPFVFRFYAGVGQDFKSTLYFVPPSPEVGSTQKQCGYSYRSPHFIEMLKQLEDEVKESGQFSRSGYMLVMDHARQHTSKMSKKAMNEMETPLVEGYPAQSWDLNLIENCWGMLHNNLQGKGATTATGWRKVILQAWGRVKQSSINSLVEGMEARVESVLENDGHWTPHH